MLTIQSGTISRCHKYLDKMGKINQQKVQKLPQEVKDLLREITPARLKELAQLNCFAADKIKSELDNKYGGNNYVLIAVGRSISSIAELMGKMGANIKIIPLSGLRRADINDISSRGLYTYKAFLKTIGLSKEKLEENKDKTYILMDYTYYGRSLEKTEKLLKQNNMLGNAPNLISMPVCEVLGLDYQRRGFKRLFEYSRFKDYSYVGKLPIDNLKNVFEKYKPERIKEFNGNITQGLRKLFWFNVFDSMKEQDYKEIMAKKELNAIYQHYLSQKAVKNFLKREMEKMNKTTKELNKQ